MDVDDFKTINDTLGHEAGDHLLIDISERLRGLLRGSDSPARLGGDEFAVILEGMKSPSDGGVVAERILEAMTVPFPIGEHEFDIRVSIGIASTNEPSMTGADLLRQADTAMYAAKIGGKNRCVTYEPSIQKELFGSVAMKIQLKRAIERGELRAVYQPIVDLRSGRLNGAEALVRWQHPDEGLIPPGSFLPMAEESGVIADIDRWMIGEACAEAVRWRRLGIEVPPPISLNLSAASLQRDDLVDTVSAILASTGALPRDIAFEVTESSLVEDLEATAERLTALKSLGMEISIDDFGTGYSSLNYLRRFPIDVLKIDKSFVDGIARGPEEASFAIAIIQLAEQLHLRTVAEGIETGDQARVLMDLGVGSAQGFYFSRPVGADTMRDLIVNAERGNDWSDLISTLPVPA
jgi:diguanylate cyclase (GGDEF)-like protein